MNDYAEYIAEKLEKQIDYSEYCDKIDKNIDYSEYIAEALGKTLDPQYKARKIREKREKKLKRIFKDAD